MFCEQKSASILKWFLRGYKILEIIFVDKLRREWLMSKMQNKYIRLSLHWLLQHACRLLLARGTSYLNHRPNSPTPAAPLSKTRTTVALPPAALPLEIPAVLPLMLPPSFAPEFPPTVAALLPPTSALLPRILPPLLPAVAAEIDKGGENEEDEEEDPPGSPVPAAPTK